MRAYLLTVLVVDHDGISVSDVTSEIEGAHYGNRCILPSVVQGRTFNIPDWPEDEDEHHLNSVDKSRQIWWLRAHGHLP